MNKKIFSFLVASQWILMSSSFAVERPSQFVLLAFDNCQENQTWREVSNFLDEMNGGGKKLKFTFFLSGVALISDKNKTQYSDPFGQKGKSNINFGGNDLSVQERVSWINRLYNSGNEIASHAVGHFRGKDWSTQNWQDEISAYNRIIDSFPSLNGWSQVATDRFKLGFKSSDIVGFRAPYLEGGSKLNEALITNKYLYDTSDTSQGWEPNTWPKKYNTVQKPARGLWNFGLGFLSSPVSAISNADLIAGLPRKVSTTKIPAMDYNFCFRQTGGCGPTDPFENEQSNDGQEMLNAYLKYFMDNYNGNRAPLHIGHHFQQYRGGIYNKALMTFARKVCGLPEVKCTTYKELVQFMESSSESNRRAYQLSQFPKLAPIELGDL